MLTIAVGTAALIIVLSVFNGFEDLVKGLYSDFYSDVRVTATKGKFITRTPQITKIKAVTGVARISLYAEEKAVLTNGDYQTIVYLKGVDDQFKSVCDIPKHIETGAYSLGSTDQPLLCAWLGYKQRSWSYAR